jgi:hypothetical protein
MKKMLIILTLLTSLAAIAEVNVEGTSALTIYGAYPNEAVIKISGEPAKVLWEKASSLAVIAPSQFSSHPFKQSNTLRCWDYTKDQMGYVCFVRVGDLAQGEVVSF